MPTSPRGNNHALSLFRYNGLINIDKARFDRKAYAAFWRDLLYLLWASQKDAMNQFTKSFGDLYDDWVRQVQRHHFARHSFVRASERAPQVSLGTL